MNQLNEKPLLLNPKNKHGILFQIIEGQRHFETKFEYMDVWEFPVTKCDLMVALSPPESPGLFFSCLRSLVFVSKAMPEDCRAPVITVGKDTFSLARAAVADKDTSSVWFWDMGSPSNEFVPEPSTSPRLFEIVMNTSVEGVVIMHVGIKDPEMWEELPPGHVPETLNLIGSIHAQNLDEYAAPKEMKARHGSFITCLERPVHRWRFGSIMCMENDEFQTFIKDNLESIEVNISDSISWPLSCCMPFTFYLQSSRVRVTDAMLVAARAKVLGKITDDNKSCELQLGLMYLPRYTKCGTKPL